MKIYILSFFALLDITNSIHLTYHHLKNYKQNGDKWFHNQQNKQCDNNTGNGCLIFKNETEFLKNCKKIGAGILRSRAITQTWATNSIPDKLNVLIRYKYYMGPLKNSGLVGMSSCLVTVHF